MSKELANLLNRAAAVIETPDSETQDEKIHLLEQLTSNAERLSPNTADCAYEDRVGS